MLLNKYQEEIDKLYYYQYALGFGLIHAMLFETINKMYNIYIDVAIVAITLIVSYLLLPKIKIIQERLNNKNLAKKENKRFVFNFLLMFTVFIYIWEVGINQETIMAIVQKIF